jgi:hypothetical protein
VREKSSNRSLNTTVRQIRLAARRRRATRSTSAVSAAACSAGGRGRRPSARWAPIERRRRPTTTGRGSWLCASACRWRPEARPSIAISAASLNSATSPTVVFPRSRSFLEWMEERELTLHRDEEQTVWLRDPARDLRQELGPRDPDRDRQADFPAYLAAQLHGDLPRRTRDVFEPAHVEKRLVDRQPLDDRRRLPEHREHRLARFAVGLEARRDDDRVRTQALGLPAAHRRAHAAGLGLIAGGEHDARADDHRPADETRIVPLFDRGVKRVEVGVEDRRGTWHEHMFPCGLDASMRKHSGATPRSARGTEMVDSASA